MEYVAYQMHLQSSVEESTESNLISITCELSKEFRSLEAYNNHWLHSHTKQPMYPELSLIKKLACMESKCNPWEC